MQIIKGSSPELAYDYFYENQWHRYYEPTMLPKTFSSFNMS